ARPSRGGARALVRRRHHDPGYAARAATRHRDLQRAHARGRARWTRRRGQLQSRAARRHHHVHAEDALMNARHHVLSGVTAIALAHAGLAQTPRVVDSSFSDLRAEGNGVAALRTIVMMGFANEPADAALRAVVLAARLNITFDPQLSGLATHVTIPSHSRTASVALLEIAQAARLRVRVSAAGQIVVVTASPEVPARRASTADSTTRPVTLPVVVSEADRVERRAFATTATIGAVSFTRSELQSAPLFV